MIDAGVPAHVAPDPAFSLLLPGDGEQVLRVEADSRACSKARFGDVPLRHATATYDEEAGTITSAPSTAAVSRLFRSKSPSTTADIQI